MLYIPPDCYLVSRLSNWTRMDQGMTSGIINGMKDVFQKELVGKGLTYDRGDVILLTATHVPQYVIFAVSFGRKFNINPACNTRKHLDREWRLFEEKVYEQADEQWKLQRLHKDFSDIRNHTTQPPSPQELFIHKQVERTRRFLKTNPHLMVTEADKGKKVFIMDRKEYNDRLEKHLMDGIVDGTYELVEDMDIIGLRDYLESRLSTLKTLTNEYFERDKQTGRPTPIWTTEPYIISEMVITLKAHKENFPPRPIVNAASRWCKKISRWFLDRIDQVAEKYMDVKVKNSEEFIERLQQCGKANPGQELATWDYESMYTNIPVDIPISIIDDNYDLVATSTHLPSHLFIELLEFLVESASYFMCGGTIYRQKKGLTMGSDLSHALADLTTNKAACRARNTIGQDRMQLLTKYVDDFAALIRKEDITVLEELLTEGIPGLNLKRVTEDFGDEYGQSTISYLDLLAWISPERNLVTTWWQKDCSTKKILNFLSFHPATMKEMVVTEYIRHAFRISSHECFHRTVKRLQHSLKKSCYPKTTVQHMLKSSMRILGTVVETSRYGVPDDTFDYTKIITEEEATYSCARKEINVSERQRNYQHNRRISMPFYGFSHMQKVKSITDGLHLDITPAPSPTKTLSRSVFTTLKQKPSLDSIKFATFTIACNSCEFKKLSMTNNTDLKRGFKITRTSKEVETHEHIFPSHVISEEPQELAIYRQRYDMVLAFNLLTRNMDC